MPLEVTIPDAASEAIALMGKRLSGFETEEGRLSGLDYVPQSSNEVMITTTPKAGTTWVQQICHQLRASQHGGDMEFEEISQVVPWLELAHDLGQDLMAPQYGHEEGLPRLFKTHAWEGHCPKGCKTIVVLRHPFDVLVSFYHFFEDWFFEPGTIGIDEFARSFWLSRGTPASRMNNASYFCHLTSWYKAPAAAAAAGCKAQREENQPSSIMMRNNDNNTRDDDTSHHHHHNETILFVFFEDLKQDLEKQVRRIAEFISTEEHDFTSNECISLAVQRSSFAYMKEHEHQFDEHMTKLARNVACGLPLDAGVSRTKVRLGQSGTGRSILSKELLDEIQSTWSKVVAPVTNCNTYEELRQQLSRHDEILL